MRFILLCVGILSTSCSGPKQEHIQSVVMDSSVADSIINSVRITQEPKTANLDWSSMTALMKSLGELPFEQRKVTLTNIKNEATELMSQPWPKSIDVNPNRSRYMVFVTYANIAADQRFGENPAQEQAAAIAKMKQSWNVFANQVNAVRASAVLETTRR